MRGRDPDTLTPRERQVLELLKRGYSNRDIAEELQVSLSGAKYHVSEIISKLGVSTREEAAAWQPERRPALIPLLSRFGGRRAAATARFASSLAVIAISIVALVAVLATQGDESPAAREALMPAHESGLTAVTPTVASAATQVAEPQPSRIGPFLLGYRGGGGLFDRLEAGDLVLTVEGNLADGAEFHYTIDDETRFLWASGGRVHFDHRTGGLVAGASTTLYFDQPMDDAAAEVPPAVVMIGYFKYLDGGIVAVGDGYVDISISPQIRTFAERYLNLDGSVVRVWVDPSAEVHGPQGDLSVGEAAWVTGRRVAFSGLLEADRSPVALWVLFKD